METSITAEELLARLKELLPEEPAYVEQTGGGVATIYVGETPTDPEGPYRLVIGPGAYDWKAPAMSEFGFEELCVSPDYPQGMSADDPHAYVSTWGEFDAAVKQFA